MRRGLSGRSSRVVDPESAGHTLTSGWLHSAIKGVDGRQGAIHKVCH